MPEAQLPVLWVIDDNAGERHASGIVYRFCSEACRAAFLRDCREDLEAGTEPGYCAIRDEHCCTCGKVIG